MLVGFGIQFSREFSNDDSSIIITIEEELNFYFADKNYGMCIEKLYIGVICVSKDFEMFFNVRPLKIYRKEKSFEYEIKLDFNKMINSDNAKRYIYIRSEILKMAKEIFLNKKIKGFDSDKFLSDLEIFLGNEISLAKRSN